MIFANEGIISQISAHSILYHFLKIETFIRSVMGNDYSIKALLVRVCCKVYIKFARPEAPQGRLEG